MFEQPVGIAYGYILRLANKNDANGLVQFYKDIADPNTGFEEMGLDVINAKIEVMKPPKIYNLVLENNKQIVGVLSLFLDAGIPNTLVIGNLAILKEHRGLGLGFKLLNISKQVAKANNKINISLHVLNKNKVARTLYERVGFKYKEEYRAYRMEVPITSMVTEHWTPIVYTSILVNW